MLGTGIFLTLTLSDSEGITEVKPSWKDGQDCKQALMKNTLLPSAQQSLLLLSCSLTPCTALSEAMASADTGISMFLHQQQSLQSHARWALLRHGFCYTPGHFFFPCWCFLPFLKQMFQRWYKPTWWLRATN